MPTQLPHTPSGNVRVFAEPQGTDDAFNLAYMESRLSSLCQGLSDDAPLDIVHSFLYPPWGAYASRADHVHASPVTYGTEDLQRGVSPLKRGHIHLVSSGRNLKCYIGTANSVATLVYDQSASPRGPDVQVFATGTATYFLAPSGRVYACGNNGNGALGHGGGAGSQTACNLSEIPLLRDVIAVSGNDNAAGFLTADGAVYTCGLDTSGNLGRMVLGATATCPNIGRVRSLPGVTRIMNHTKSMYFIDADGDAYSCGNNQYGQLGRNVATGALAKPNLGKIDGVSGVRAIYANGGSAFLLTTDGRVYSCGYNNYGQLGRAVATGKATATNLARIEELSDVVDIVCTADGTFFLTAAGAVYSCGYNYYGQLGRVAANASATVSNLGVVPGLPAIAQIAANAGSAHFLTRGGAVYNCGQNSSGQLGRYISSYAAGSATYSNLGSLPLGGVTQIVSGDVESYFLMSDGTVQNCGRNSNGQLGRVRANGTTTSANLDAVPGLTNVVRITSVGLGACFVTATGAVYSCGYNNVGQLGRAVATGSTSTVNLGVIEFDFA